MKAWIIDKIHDLQKETNPLVLTELPKPVLSEGEILLKISACGVCHMEIDEIKGRLTLSSYPVIPGHQVVGIVEQVMGSSVNCKLGDRVGVAWIFNACGKCEYCFGFVI